MKFVIFLLMLLPATAQAAPFPEFDADYPWLSTFGAPADKSMPLQQEIPPPSGYTRVPSDGWGTWLRNLPLQPKGLMVLTIDGNAKPDQTSHYRVINLDILPHQECADSIWRLRAEYMVSIGQAFRFSSMEFQAGTRQKLNRFLRSLFANKGTLNMAQEMRNPNDHHVKPGDVLVRGGSPGHAVLVLDVVQDRKGDRMMLLGNGYMPAQNFHVLRAARGAWYYESALNTGLWIPLGYTFTWADHRRF